MQLARARRNIIRSGRHGHDGPSDQTQGRSSNKNIGSHFTP
jgi:hypothetical protein